jgi:hypothetical protein
MTTYNNPFTGQTIQPSSVGYEALTISGNTSLSWSINGLGGNVPTAASIMNVTATDNGFALIMPPAYQVSNGQDILINNVGNYPFNVLKNDGVTAITTVASGAVQYIYLTDNTTTNGSWNAFTFGTGTSAANAATLSGYGISAIGNTLNQVYPVTTYYTNYTLMPSAQAGFAVWAGGVGTFTLPSASTVGANWFINIGNYGTGILTLTPVGSDAINGNSSQQLQLTESLVLVSNGTGWNTFGYGRSNSFVYTQFAYDLSSLTTPFVYTLSAANAANTIQTYSGVLHGNTTIVVPSTVQLYTITNNTTGSYTLTVKTAASGGTSIVVPQSNSLVLISDGTNIYNAASGSASTITSLTLGNGSLATPSLKFTGDIETGLYLPSSGNMTVIVLNAAVAAFTSTGVSVTGTGTFSGGISGGTF